MSCSRSRRSVCICPTRVSIWAAPATNEQRSQLVVLLLLRASLAHAPQPVRSTGCGDAFRDAAAAALTLTQQPRGASGCAQARLLVVRTEAFEGMGSTLIGLAEALAEAHSSQRTLVLGPLDAQPYLLRDATCADEGAGFECYFRPLGLCSWEDVSYDEAVELPLADDSARVKLSHPRRGGPSLYLPARSLARLLPEGADSASEAECWAGAVVARVMRPVPALALRLRALEASLPPPSRPLVGVHLRRGDLTLRLPGPGPGSGPGHDGGAGERVYSHKPLLGARALGDVARAAAAALGWTEPASPALSCVLATDAEDAESAAGDIALGLGVRRDEVLLLDRFRTEHGSHTAAFGEGLLRDEHVLALPYELLRPADPAWRERVRLEAIEDLWLLSHADLLVGVASSHFSVLARLMAVGRDTRGARITPAWADSEDVLSGELACGWLHGQLNATIPLPPRALVEALRDGVWSSPPALVGATILSSLGRTPSSAASCERSAECHAVGNECNVSESVRLGELFDSSAHMKPLLALAILRRAILCCHLPTLGADGVAVEPQHGEQLTSARALVRTIELRERERFAKYSRWDQSSAQRWSSMDGRGSRVGSVSSLGGLSLSESA